MKRAYTWAAVFTVLALGLSALILFGSPMPLKVRVTLALGVSITLLYTGAAIVFLLALKGYKYRLRVAYRYICASMFLVSLGTLQFVFIGAFNALDSARVIQGGAGLPFALMVTLAYLGVRIFAKLVEVESALTNTWAGLGTAVGGGILTLVIARLVDPSQALYDIPMAMNGYGTTALVVTAILVTKIRQVTGPLYLAGFASNKAHIDPTLDKVRIITANMEPDKHLTDEQQNTLAAVYLELEDFLVNSETVRQYRQSDLRQMIELRFHEIVSERFWQRVQADQKATLPVR